MFQKRKTHLLIFMGALLLLEFAALIISAAFAVHLVILSAIAALALRFLYIDAKEEESKKKIQKYMKRLM